MIGDYFARKVFESPFEQGFRYRLFAKPLSLIYGFLASKRRFWRELSRPYRAEVPVIGIGNIVVGGTGKSPFVVFIAQLLVSRGLRPIVLNKGYRGNIPRNAACLLVNGRVHHAIGFSDLEVISDEAVEQSFLLSGIPVVVSPDPVFGLKWLEHLGMQPTDLLVDDGFQNPRVHKDCNIILYNWSEYNRVLDLLPAGPLRESRNLEQKADMVVITCRSKEEQIAAEESVGADPLRLCWWPEAADMQRAGRWESELPNGPSLAVVGISRPNHFLTDLVKIGIEPAAKLVVSDHQQLTTETIRRSLGDCRAIVTTAKDYFRDPGSFEAQKVPTYVLMIRPQISVSSSKKLEQLVFRKRAALQLGAHSSEQMA